MEAPGNPDNVAPNYYKIAQSTQLQQKLQAARSYAQAAGTLPQAQPGSSATTEVDPTDPLGIRFLKDVGRGTIEAIPQALGGAADAVNETLQAMDSLANWLNENVADLGDSTKPGEGLQLPTVDPAKSTTGNLVRKASQFLTGFIPAFKGVKAVTGGAAVSGAGRFAQAATAGGITDAFVFDPHEERLSNLVEEFPQLSNPITAYLAADPNDSEAEGRFKNFIEGLGLGTITDGIFAGIKAIRANRIAQGLESPIKDIPVPRIEQGADETWKVTVPEKLPEEMKITAGAKTSDTEVTFKTQEAANAFAERYQADTLRTAIAKEPVKFETALIKTDPKRPFITDPEVGTKIASGKATPDDLARALDFSQLNTPENIQRAVNRFAKLEKEANNLVSKKFPNEGRPPVVGDAEVKRLADQLNITPEDLLTKQQFMKGNRALDAERIVAVSKLLEASTIKVQELADKAATATDQKDLYDFVKMMHIHSAVQKFFKGASSESGRALRALQIPNGSVAKQLAMLNESLTGVGGAGQIRKVAEAVRAARGNRRQLNKVLENSFSRKMSDTLTSVWYFNLLSGIKTHAANILGTGLNTVWQIPERYLASKISALRGTVGGVEEGEASALMFGYINASGDALRAMWQTIKTGEQSELVPGLTRPEPRTRAISGENYGLGNAPDGTPGYFLKKGFDALGAFFDAPTRAIMAEDEFFRVIGKSGEMNALAFRQARAEGLEGEAMAKRIQEIVQNPSDEMLEGVSNFMQDLTFSAPLGRLGQAVQAATNAHPILKLAMPFIRTPVNLLKAAGRRNFITGPLMGSVQADLKRGGAARDLALARMALGSMVSLVVMDLALKGVVTGAGPSGHGDNKAVQAAWRVNHQPYSIRVGDTWYNYNRTDPFGIMLGAVATYAELAGQVDNNTLDELAGSIVIATSQSVFSKTWLKGPAELLDAITQPDRYGANWIEQTMGTLLVPAGVAQIAQTNDPVWREVNSVLDAVKARIPGLSETLPPRRNMWGKPIMMEGGLGPDIISPVYSQEMQNDPISQYITDNKIAVDLPTRTQFNVELTPDEYSEFVRRAGEPAHERLNAIIAGNDQLSQQWNQATDGPEGGRALIVRSIVQTYRDIARAQMLKESPDLQSRVRMFETNRANALVRGPGG